MKFLLTSGGVTNGSIAKAFFDLVGKPASEITLAFIPTAANVDEGDKGWLIEDLSNLKNLKLKCIDIVDISAVPKDIWLPRLEAADVLFFSGGMTPHLMYWLKQSGLAELLPELLKTRLYAGISAGSMVVGPSIALSNYDKRLYYKKWSGYGSEEGLNLVDFYFRPHLNSRFFPEVNKEALKAIAEKTKESIYVLDDQSALKVVDGNVEVISEGEHLVFNKK